MDTFTKKTFTTSRNLTYTYYTSPLSPADTNKPALLFLHGWPDEAFLWNKVISLLKNVPNRIIVPDLLGYAGTDKPLDAALYNSKSQSADLAEILDSENVKRVVSIGHDWGAFLAQRFYLWRPERVVAVILLSVPYLPPDAQPFDLDATNAMTEAMTGRPRMAYWEFFTAADGPSIMEGNMDATWDALHGDDDEVILDLLCKKDGMREWYAKDGRAGDLRPYARDEAVKKRFCERIKRDGFEAPMMWYFAHKDNHHYAVEKDIPKERIVVSVPLMYLACSGDAVSSPDMIYVPQKAGLLPDLTVEVFESGHWSPLEVPEKNAHAIEKFLEEKGL